MEGLTNLVNLSILFYDVLEPNWEIMAELERNG